MLSAPRAYVNRTLGGWLTTNWLYVYVSLAVFYGGILGRRNTIESDKLDLSGNLTTFNITDISNTITTPPSSPTDVYMAIGIGTAVSGVSALSMIYAFRRDIWWPPPRPINGGFW